MSFLSVMPNGTGKYYPLRVIQGDIDVIPDVKLNVTDLNRGNNNILYKQFFNNGFGGITFKVSIKIKRDDRWDTQPVINVIGGWVSNSTILKVATDAIDVPNGTYIITKNPSRKQSYNDSTTWELEFTTYTALNIHRYANDNSSVLAALSKAKKDEASKKKKAAKNAYQLKLSKCDRKVLVYSKKKKSVKCVKYLQKLLQLNGFYLKYKVDGWYGKDTKNAVKQYQSKNKGKVLFLKPNGKMDAITFATICGNSSSVKISRGK